MAITKTILTNAFMGMNTFRWKASSSKLIAAQDWDLEIPILRDSLTFTPEEPTINRAYIHGSSKPIGSTMQNGGMPLQFDIPSVDADTLGFVANLGSTAPASMTDTVDGASVTWVPLANGLKLGESKPISGMCMILSEDKEKALVIKNLEGYARPIMDGISTTPVAFRVNLELSEVGDSSDTDGDIIFYSKTANI